MSAYLLLKNENGPNLYIDHFMEYYINFPGLEESCNLMTTQMPQYLSYSKNILTCNTSRICCCHDVTEYCNTGFGTVIIQ